MTYCTNDYLNAAENGLNTYHISVKKRDKHGISFIALGYQNMAIQCDTTVTEGDASAILETKGLIPLSPGQMNDGILRELGSFLEGLAWLERFNHATFFLDENYNVCTVVRYENSTKTLQILDNIFQVLEMTYYYDPYLRRIIRKEITAKSALAQLGIGREEDRSR